MSEIPNEEDGLPADTLALMNLLPNFDEEALQRHEHEMDQIIREFEDEPFVRHDETPESDFDEDRAPSCRRVPRRTHIRRGKGRLYFHQTFNSGVTFKENVVDHALRSLRNLYQYMYDKDKLGFKCYGVNDDAEGCKWQAYASIHPKDKVWRIRKYKSKHSCVPNGECTLLRVPVIARLFLDKIRDEPDYYKPAKIKEITRERWGITASRDQIQAARCKALKWIETEYEHQFSRLSDYVAELENYNENSSVELQTDLIM